MSSGNSMFQRAITSELAASMFPGAVLVEAWSQDLTRVERWKKYGYLPLYALYQDGLHYDEDGSALGTHVVDMATPYGQALRAITEDIEAGELPAISYAQVVFSMFAGTFDESDWVLYLPDASQ